MGGTTRTGDTLRSRARWRAGAALVALLAIVSSPATAGAGDDRPFGDAKILAKLPPEPGFPEGIAVKGNRVYVAGPATFGTTGKGPSTVHGFDVQSGALVSTYPTQGENLLAEHANSSIAFDGNGRLYVLNTQLGIYRLSPVNGKQEAYGRAVPRSAALSHVAPGVACAPTPVDTPPLPNDIVFDGAGNAYVTDSRRRSGGSFPGAACRRSGSRMPAWPPSTSVPMASVSTRRGARST